MVEKSRTIQILAIFFTHMMKIYGTCISCEFEASGDNLEQLDAKFKHHFVMRGHESYFYKEKNIQKLRKIS